MTTDACASAAAGVLHIHTDMEECTLERLVCVKDPHTGAVTKERPRALLKGQVGRRGLCCRTCSAVTHSRALS